MLARTGSYNVRSRVIDDDATVWLDFEWGETSRTPSRLSDMYRLQALQGVVAMLRLDAIVDDPDEYHVLPLPIQTYIAIVYKLHLQAL